jgi:hypothetical protein
MIFLILAMFAVGGLLIMNTNDRVSPLVGVVMIIAAGVIGCVS